MENFNLSGFSESTITLSNFGDIWAAKDSNRFWTSISVSSSGQYQSAVVLNGQIYVSSDFGNKWSAKDSNRGWQSVSVSSLGQY